MSIGFDVYQLISDLTSLGPTDQINPTALFWSLIPHMSPNKWWVAQRAVTIGSVVLNWLLIGTHAEASNLQVGCANFQKLNPAGFSLLKPRYVDILVGTLSIYPELSWISQSVLMGGGSSACRDPHQGRSVSLAPVVPPRTRLHQGKALRSSCHTSGKHQEYTRVQLKSWFSEETSGALSASYKHWKNLLPWWNHWCTTTSSSMRITPEHQNTIDRLN